MRASVPPSLTFLLTASLVLGGLTIDRHRECATHLNDEDITVAERYFDANKTEGAKIANTAVKVYWHAGNITWTLANITRTISADWFNNAAPSTSQQIAMKPTRQGSKSDLNVYSIHLGLGLGCGSPRLFEFPSSYSGAPKDVGIVLLFSSVPGGSTSGYNLGRTLTHEPGRRLGLYPTFQGGCAGSGSSTAGGYVADTPAESSALSSCPSKRDTCTGTNFTGADPVTNFMDYSSDACMTQFTPGQMSRATQFATYRI
ncbi:metalloprotease [Mycena vulgaris]|nr:metalloprotease [Mycena vulgaris]